MMDGNGEDFFIWQIFNQLLRRGFLLGIEEYEALREALWAGFGWSSRRELLAVCSALWAKSRAEQAVIAALFDQMAVPDWRFDMETAAAEEGRSAAGEIDLDSIGGERDPGSGDDQNGVQENEDELREQPPPVTRSYARLPHLTGADLPQLAYAHVFLPHYPVNYRGVAQAWRRLRRPVRAGPLVELDIKATVSRRSRSGVASPPVLRARRRNRESLLLLVDRQGSMAPFHSFVEEVCAAIIDSGRLRRVGLFYFHDVPLEGADADLLDDLSTGAFPRLDPVLPLLEPLIEGDFATDPALQEPVEAKDVLAAYARDAAIVIISDGGAGRRKYEPLRLLDSAAFLKGLKNYSNRVVWLNPLPAERWQNCTAMELARHVPMFTMNKEGMHEAVNVLRGRPFRVDQPV